MKTLIQTLFSTKKKELKRKKAGYNKVFADQFTKLGKLGAQLVVMSR